MSPVNHSLRNRFYFHIYFVDGRKSDRSYKGDRIFVVNLLGDLNFDELI